MDFGYCDHMYCSLIICFHSGESVDLMLVRFGRLLTELIGEIMLAQGNYSEQVGVIMALLNFGFRLLEEGFDLL